MNNQEGLLSNSNRQWVLGGATIILGIVMGLGGIVASNLQSQIDSNQERIYSINSKAVTDERLDRQIQQVTDYIDVRIQSLEAQQREISRQLTILVEDSKEFQNDMRERINNQ